MKQVEGVKCWVCEHDHDNMLVFPTPYGKIWVCQACYQQFQAIVRKGG